MESDNFKEEILSKNKNENCGKCRYFNPTHNYLYTNYGYCGCPSTKKWLVEKKFVCENFLILYKEW